MLRQLRSRSKEEALNVLSHFIGVIFGIVGLYFLRGAYTNEFTTKSFAILLYSFCFILLFMASTVYHFVIDVQLKERLRVVDHISIYLLIAGTYSPVTLITLAPSHGHLLFAVVWLIAGLGAILKLFFTGRFEALSLALYLVMGWLIVFDLSFLSKTVGEGGLFYLMLGGLFYTFGIVFYVWRKLPYNHFVWHLFVLGGAISHWWFIYSVII